MHAGCWRKVDEVNPPEWALKIKLTLDQLQALERRTHVEGLMEDPMDPVIFNPGRGGTTRSLKGSGPQSRMSWAFFWADGPDGKWKRETRTWTLPDPDQHLWAPIHIQDDLLSLEPDAHCHS